MARTKIEVFFHISKVKQKYPDLAERLEKGDYYNVSFWYDTEMTDRGVRVREIWLESEELPETYSDVFKQLISRVISHWGNIEVVLPDRLDKTTSLAFGQVQRNTLHEHREKLIREQQDKQARERELALQKQKDLTEKARIAAEQARIVTAVKWRDDPTGIRNNETLRYICVQCGSEDVELGRFHTNPVCRKCGTTWYINHCWSCKNGRVDSRDPQTPKCAVCKWYKCAFCSACHQNGCSTNRYSRGFRYVDDPSPMLSSSYEQEHRDELRASAAEYGFNLDSDDVSYDEEMGMFFDGDHWYPV